MLGDCWTIISLVWFSFFWHFEENYLTCFDISVLEEPCVSLIFYAVKIYDCSLKE